MDTPIGTAAGPIDADITCVSCGYMLRGLQSTICPECGCEIARSLAAFEACPRYPRLAALGRRRLNELRLGVCFVLGGFLAFVSLWWIGQRRMDVTWYTKVFSARHILCLVCFFWGLGFWGVWKLGVDLSIPPALHRPGFRWWGPIFIVPAVLTPVWMALQFVMSIWFDRDIGGLGGVLTGAGLIASCGCIGLCMIGAARCAAVAKVNWLTAVAWTVGIIHSLAYFLFVASNLPQLVAGPRSLELADMLPGPLGSPLLIRWYWNEVLTQPGFLTVVFEFNSLILLGYLVLQLSSLFVLVVTAVLLFRARAMPENPKK